MTGIYRDEFQAEYGGLGGSRNHKNSPRNPASINAVLRFGFRWLTAKFFRELNGLASWLLMVEVVREPMRMFA